MKTILILLSLLFLVSCGLKKVEHKSLNIHPDFQAYVQRWEEISGKKIDNLTITYASSTIDGLYGVLAYCQYGENQVYKKAGTELHVYQIRKIVIDPKDWNDYIKTKEDRELLMFHEMGHCVLGKGHNTKYYTKNNGPNGVSYHSIMYPYHIHGTTYIAHYNYYLTELFNSRNIAGYSTNFNGGYYSSMVNPNEQNDHEVELEHSPVHPSELHDGCVHDLGTTITHEEDSEENED